MKKILFLADRRGWAFDICVRSLIPFLDGYSCDIAYVWEKPDLSARDFDLLYVCWWGESYHRQFNIGKSRVLKEISSHRWQYEAKFGHLTPQQTYERFMTDAGTLIATSGRLYRAMQPAAPRVMSLRLGVPENIRPRQTPRTGDLVFGWAGSPSDPQKGLIEVIRPAIQGLCTLLETDGSISHADMDAFYERIDVLLIGSLSEGTPLPLLEAMRKGCFVVATDVGVVDELVLSGVNGLIVPRTVTDFQSAIAWCQGNVDRVRQAGAANSRISDVRRWSDAGARLKTILENHLLAYS